MATLKSLPGGMIRAGRKLNKSRWGEGKVKKAVKQVSMHVK